MLVFFFPPLLVQLELSLKLGVSLFLEVKLIIVRITSTSRWLGKEPVCKCGALGHVIYCQKKKYIKNEAQMPRTGICVKVSLGKDVLW